MLAEIISKNIVRKLLPLQAEEKPGDFSWNEMSANNVIAEDVLAEYQRRQRVLVTDAHRIMVDESEIMESKDVSNDSIQTDVG